MNHIFNELMTVCTFFYFFLCVCVGGDSKTLMIVQIAPVEKNVGETCASLSFAQRVRSVELGQATKRVETVENGDSRPEVGLATKHI